MNVEMSMASSQSLFAASTALSRAGFRASKGKSRTAYPHVLVVKGVPDDLADEVRRKILAIDPDAKPVTPPSSYVYD